MYKFGVCTGIENIEYAARIGFDFIECSFAWLNGLSDVDFNQVLSKVEASQIKVEACNVMLPSSIKVVGKDVCLKTIREYLSKSFSRAQMIGVNVIVFGSGGSRGVPNGYPHNQAWHDIDNYLRVAEEYCEKYDITVAIEPLQRKECNILNFVSEATLLSSLLELPHIGVLGDTHHMICGNEPYSALEYAGTQIKHIHISHSYGIDGGRDYPYKGDGSNYDELFRTLAKMNYAGRISIEAGCTNFQQDALNAIDLLNEYRELGAVKRD